MWQWLLPLEALLFFGGSALDCSATTPLQQVAPQGGTVQLLGLSILHDDEDEWLDLSLASQTGFVTFGVLSDLQLLPTSEPHIVALRGRASALQAALDSVSYSSCMDCGAQLDTVTLRCAGGLTQSEALLQMEMALVAPRLRATSLYHWATSDASAPQPVLVIRDVTVEPELSSAVLTLNITASSGTVAVEHDWHASGAILKGTARELNGLLKKSGITFKPDPSAITSSLVTLSICLTDADLAPLGDCILMNVRHVVTAPAAAPIPAPTPPAVPEEEVAAVEAGYDSDVLHVWMHATNDLPQLQRCDGSPSDTRWFAIEEDAWEAPTCILLTDDADEMGGTFLNLQVSVSVGLIHCQGSKQPGRAGLFGTTCAGISSEPKSAPQLGKTCELRSEVAMRPSLEEVQSCLRQLVYTPPSNFNGEVQMRIVVADNGYTNFLQGSQEDPKMVIQDVTIQVEAVNDMPYLSWLHLPPKEMLNNESFPFRGLRVQDPDVVGWRAENEAVFTLTFQTGAGELLFPLGEPLWREQVPAPPYPSRYLRLQGTLQQIQDSFQRILYKPPEWFVGEDQVVVRVSDGGVSGGGNLTGELGFEVKVLQARIPVGLTAEAEELKGQEDHPLRFGHEGKLRIAFAAQKPMLYLKISSPDGALRQPLMNASVLYVSPHLIEEIGRAHV